MEPQELPTSSRFTACPGLLLYDRGTEPQKRNLKNIVGISYEQEGPGGYIILLDSHYIPVVPASVRLYEAVRSLGAQNLRALV